MSRDPRGQAGGDRGESDGLGLGVMGLPAGVSAEGHSWDRGQKPLVCSLHLLPQFPQGPCPSSGLQGPLW